MRIGLSSTLNLFLDREMDCMRTELGKLSRSWPSALAEINLAVISRTGFQPTASASDGWSSQFDPLTLLYPALHFELLPNADASLLRKWNVLHMLYLIHSVTNDRLLDGQIQADASYFLYDRFVLLQAERSLRELIQNHADWWETLHHEYICHQLGAADSSDQPSSSWNDIARRLEAAAAGRAALGFLATSAMLTANGMERASVQKVYEAFKCIVIALQWCDDFEDWRDDYTQNRSNLMLVRMRHISRSSEISSLPIVAAQLMESGARHFALERASTLFAQAREHYCEFGAIMLSELIGQKSNLVSQKLDRLMEVFLRRIMDGLNDQISEAGVGLTEALPQ